MKDKTKGFLFMYKLISSVKTEEQDGGQSAYLAYVSLWVLSPEPVNRIKKVGDIAH